VFRQVIGLSGPDDAALADPSDRVGWSLASQGDDLRPGSGWRMRLAYHLLHHSRHGLPFRLSAKLIGLAASRSASHPHGGQNTVEAIARAVAATEDAVGFSDCYPRALLTAWLALAAGNSCVLAIGVLAPTRKLHAWCTVAGVLPFEPVAEHYLYQPAWTITLP